MIVGQARKLEILQKTLVNGYSICSISYYLVSFVKVIRCLFHELSWEIIDSRLT